MRGGEPGASAAGASGTGADGAEGEKNDLKPEGRKSFEKCRKNGKKCQK